MASVASLVSLGSTSVSQSGYSEGSLSLVHGFSLSRNAGSFRPIWVGKRWRYVGVCRYSVTTTDYIDEQGTSVSLDRGSKDKNDVDLVLKAAPKPLLKSPPKIQPPVNNNTRNSVGWDPSKLGGHSEDGKSMDDEGERNKVMESLGEVLEKAEKLETSSTKRVSISVNKTPTNTTADQRNAKPVNSVDGLKSTASKSVWRKGNPVASVPKFVNEPPKVEKIRKHEPWVKEVDKVDSQLVGNLGPADKEESQPVGNLRPPDKVESQPVANLRPPQPPLRVQPALQAKPAVAPPPAPPPLVKKPTILKDVGAAPKTPTIDGIDLASKTKEHKTILVDKFASKKPLIDPLIAEAVLAPPRPGKGPAAGKLRDDFRKKSGGPSGRLRRRKGDEDEIADEEAALLDVSIPGVTKRRKGRKWSKASRKAARLQAAREAAPVKVEILEVGEEGMMADELAYNLAISEGEIFGYLFSRGMGMHGLQSIDRDVVKMICREYDVEVIDADPTRVEDMARKKEILDEEDLDSLEDRPPVLTIMGHVDHGKTTLLDYIRTSKVVASEAGGITQGIGAYVVPVPIDGKLQTCVFLDTPGHEAFGAMRARGARVTDIAIIVVAADDGIRPQTNEAIAHAKAAGVPIVIAINKIDRDGANPDRVMEELVSIGLMPENWGGDVPVVQVSALKGDNVDELLETVMLVAELQDLKANPHRSAKGTVIEAGLDKFKGPVATFIVQNGTLKKGDIIVSGAAFGKVRALFDEKGNRVDQAGPSIPVQVIGLDNVPIAGDEFEVVSSLDAAREKAEARAESLRKDHIAAQAGYGKVTLASLASGVSKGKSGLDVHQLNIVLKVDVQGSIEAITQALRVLPQDNVSLKFLLQSPGDVSTSDIDLAVVSKAIVLGFNVKAPGPVKAYADNKGIEIRLYKVIYDLIDDVRNAMQGLLEPVEEHVTIGAAEVRAIFTSGSGRVAGCMVTEGKVVKDSGIRVLRNGKIVYVGVLNSLRRVKEMAKEVNAGLECGIVTGDFDDWAVGDIIEAFKSVKKKRTLEEASATMAAAIERTQQ
ncbi:translation initiation factor IF-2, chloroplastic-like [Rhododendron vialii]|uniref:translation initiation factor IF-2, chloroplastic-like n=1 Tax=Rhododendron vialii TaxID=182163 RepID=UPI00265D8C24|nr:translation initiation factor IF-2, chloroplastic-like [Rhododendron vialii]